MGNQKSKDRFGAKKDGDSANGPTDENGSRRFPSYHLPFQKKKKKKSSTIKRLMSIFNRKRNANKKKIQIKIQDEVPNVNNSGLFLGHKPSNASYCSPYLLLQDADNDPLANYWPPLLHSHLSLINKGDDEQLSKINIFDMDEMEDQLQQQDELARKISRTDEDLDLLESMAIHEVYSSFIQQAREKRLTPRDEPAVPRPPVSSSASRSRSSSSGATGEAVTCSSGSSADFEDAYTSLADRKDHNKDQVDVLKSIEEVSFEELKVYVEQTPSEEPVVNIYDRKLANKQNLEIMSDTVGNSQEELIAQPTIMVDVSKPSRQVEGPQLKTSTENLNSGNVNFGNTVKTPGEIKIIVVMEQSPTLLPRIETIMEPSSKPMPKIEANKEQSPKLITEIKEQSPKLMHKIEAIKEQSPTVMPKNEEIKEQSTKTMPKIVAFKEQSPKQMLKIGAVNEKSPKPMPKIEAIKEQSPEPMLKIGAVKEKSPKPMPKIEAIKEQTPKSVPEIEAVEENSPKTIPKTVAIKEQSPKPIPKIEAIKEQSSQLLPKIVAINEEFSQLIPKLEIFKEESPQLKSEIEVITEQPSQLTPKIEVTLTEEDEALEIPDEMDKSSTSLPYDDVEPSSVTGTCEECQLVENNLAKIDEITYDDTNLPNETVEEFVVKARVSPNYYENIDINTKIAIESEVAATDERSDNQNLVSDTNLKVENVYSNVEEVERSDNGHEASASNGQLAKAVKEEVKDESSISLSDGDKESSCDGSESSVMDIGDDIWDEDELVETVAEAAVSIKTKLVLDLLNHSEVDMEDFNAFLNLPCPLEEKYQFLQVQKLFDANQIQDSGNLDELGRCFRVLSRYGLDLLKPIEERPMYWKKILLPMETPTCRWLSVLGAQEILLEFGYQRVESGLIYPEGEEADSEAVAAWVVELLLAAHELSCFSLQAHPHPDFFKQSLVRNESAPQIQTDEPPTSLPSTSFTQKDTKVDTEESLFDALKKSSSAPLITKETEEESEMIGRRTLVPWLTPGKENSRPLPKPPSPVTQTAVQPGAVGLEGPKSPSSQRCHLCGSSSPAVRCEKCSNLIFCLSCDDMYHRHPKRRDHVRKLAQRPASHTSPPPRPPPKCTDLSSPPVPPPRRRKSQLSAPSSPVAQRKNEQKVPELPKKQFPLKFGSLKKLLPTMHGRPAAQLPPQSPSTQQPQPEQRFQPRHIDLIDRKQNGHRQLHSPMGRNYEEQWISHPMDQSSSDVDEEEDGRSTGTSSGGRGGYGYPMDEQWPSHLRPPRYPGPANSRSIATLERQPNHQSTLLRHNNSFAAPSSAGPYVKRDNPFFYHPTNINHSTSVMDLSYPHNIGYPLPQVQSMSEGLDYAGAIAPCGCHPTWIGPDQFGVWIPPTRCPMHNSPAAMYPIPPQPPHPNSPHVMPPPPWGYPQPYMTSTSPPPPTTSQPPLSQTHSQNGNKNSISSPPTSHHSKSSSSKREDRRSTLQSPNGKRHGLSSSSDEEDEVDHEEYYSPSEEEERRWKEEHLRPKSSKTKTLQKSAEVKPEPPVEKMETKDEQWECEHCTFLNDKETRICAVCCKTRGLRRSPTPPALEQPPEPKPPVAAVTPTPTTTTTATVHQEVSKTPKTILKAPSATEEIYEEILNPKVPKSTSSGTQCAEDDLPSVQPKAASTETSTETTPKEVKPTPSPSLVKHVTSTGTSPPPQTISTQTPVDMWHAPESSDEEEEDERVLRSPSPSPQPPPTSNQRRRRGRRDSSMLRRAASLQMVNRDRKFSTCSREKEDRGGHAGGGWYQDSVRRASSRASLRDTSPSPPPATTTRNKRWSSYAQRRTSAYEPRAGYSSKEEEPGDDEYDVEDDDDVLSINKSRKDYYLSLEELVDRRRSKNVKNQGIEILRLVKEAEKANFNAEDLQVAIHQCGLNEPVQWLRDNWKTMIDTVTTLASRKDNGIGAISSGEAKEALRVHKGNIWAAVTECIETRQKKVIELQSRSGNLSREEVTAALTASGGDVEEAALQMNKTSLKPFLMRIYGPPSGIENEAGAIRDTGVKRFHELFDKPQAESYGNPEDSCSEGSSYVMDSQLDSEEMSYLEDVDASLIKDIEIQILLKSGQGEINRQGINKNENESKVLQVKSNQEIHLEKQVLNSKGPIHNDSHGNTNDKHKATEPALEKVTVENHEVPKEQHDVLMENREVLMEYSKVMVDKQEVPKVQHEVPKVQNEVPKVQHEVPKVQHEVLKVQHEVPKVQHEVPKVQHEVPKVQHEVPKVQHEVPKVQHEVPKVQHEVLMENGPVLMENDKVQLDKQEVSNEMCEVSKEQHDVPKEKRELPKENSEVTVENCVPKGPHEVLMEKREVLMKDNKLRVEKQEVPKESSKVAVENHVPKEPHEVLVKDSKVTLVKQILPKENREPPIENSKVNVDNHKVPKEQHEVLTEKREVLTENSKIMPEKQQVPMEKHEVPKEKRDLPKENKRLSVENHEVQMDKHEGNQKLELATGNLNVVTANQNVTTESDTLHPEIRETSEGHDSLKVNYVHAKDKQKFPVNVKKFEEIQEVLTNKREVCDDDDDVCQEISSVQEQIRVIPSELLKDHAISTRGQDTSNTAQTANHESVIEKHGPGNNVYSEEFIKQNLKSESVATVANGKTDIQMTNNEYECETEEIEAHVSSKLTEYEHQYQKVSMIDFQNASADIKVQVQSDETGIENSTATGKGVDNKNDTMEQSPVDSSEVEPCCNQSEVFYDAFPDPIDEPSVAKLIENSVPVRFISQSQVQLVRPTVVDIQPPDIKNTGDVVQSKPEVIVKTLFVRAGIPTVITNRLETVSELAAPELAEAVELIEAASTLTEVVVTSNVDSGHNHLNKADYQVQQPVETRFAAVAEVPVVNKEPVASTSRTQPVVKQAMSKAMAEAVETLLPPAKEDTDESSAVASSASELGQTETEDDDEEEVEPMEPPLPVKPDLGRRARQFLAEGKLPNYYKAELAVKLLDLRFEESEAIFAANECSDLYMAVSYLQQDCELCAGRFPMGKMISMLNCVHRCCRACAKDYFTLKIKERSILETGCPFCCEPDLSDDEVATLYFNHLDIMLKNLVETDVHELFQRKLRDRALMNEPNFRWCDKCGSGFIGDPNRRRIICPDCKTVTCGHCNKPWEKQHEGISCQQFEEWRQENDPEYQKQGLESYLAENGIHCPKCKFKYDLAKGGCMHFTCSQCKFEFCSGCGKAFRMAGKCTVSERCEKLGLHAHHPRNCLFYLRDKDPEELKKLLDEHHVQYDEGEDSGSKRIVRCAVVEQRETPDGHMDAVCGREVEAKHAGLCRGHYVEYLVSLVGEHKVDPVSIMDGAALEQELRRKEKKVPERKPGELPEEYREVLVKVVLKEIPLEDTEVPYLARRPSKVVT